MSSRDVEVLCRLKTQVHDWLANPDDEELALSVAISALEARAELVVTDHAYQAHPPDPRFCGCSVAKEFHASEGAETATSSRLRTLEADCAAMRRALEAWRCYSTSSGTQSSRMFIEAEALLPAALATDSGKALLDDLAAKAAENERLRTMALESATMHSEAQRELADGRESEAAKDKRIAELRAVAARLQWRGTSPDSFTACCLLCRAPAHRRTHEPTCSLGQALGDAP